MIDEHVVVAVTIVAPTINLVLVIQEEVVVGVVDSETTVISVAVEDVTGIAVAGVIIEVVREVGIVVFVMVAENVGLIEDREVDRMTVMIAIKEVLLMIANILIVRLEREKGIQEILDDHHHHRCRSHPITKTGMIRPEILAHRE